MRPGGAGLSPLPFTARGEPYLSHITARGVPSAYNRKGATPAPLGAVLVLGVSLGAAGPSWAVLGPLGAVLVLGVSLGAAGPSIGRRARMGRV